MDQAAFSNSISAAGFTIERADTPLRLGEAYRLRHEIYCLERAWEHAGGREETDEFDARAHHVLLRDTATGEAFGTVRVIVARPGCPHDSFPIQRVAEPGLLSHLPLASTGEISRFAIARRRRPTSAGAMLQRLALMRGVALMSDELALTHWCALMERTLLRLLASSGIHFHPVGPLVCCHGTRQPAAGSIAGILGRLRREQFAVWNYVTAHGTLCRPTRGPAPPPS